MAAKKQKNNIFTLSSLRQLKALAHLLRYRIFEKLAIEPRTAKQMADLLGTKPTKLYHHFRILEEEGLIKKVGTRKKRGTIEKYYKAVADWIVVDPGLLGVNVVPVQSLYSSAIQATMEEIVEVKRAYAKRKQKPQILLKRLRIRSTQAKLQHLKRKLVEWTSACESASGDDGEVDYAITVAFYPALNDRDEGGNP